jgi:hypothetical protein
MKKVFLSVFMLVCVLANAKVWYITTSCGVRGSINMADNATLQQLVDAVAMYNANHCGVYPSKVTITMAT